MLDAEELYYKLRAVVEEYSFNPGDEADEALADAARKIVNDFEVVQADLHSDDDDYRGPNDRYQMYTRAGNDALAERVSHLAQGCRQGLISRRELPEAIERMREDVARTHGEVFDTEPRVAVYDELDKVCDELGWKSLDEY